MVKYLYYLILILPYLFSCTDQTPPSGVVATVNGEQIYLHSVETLLDSRSSSFALSPNLTVEDMKKSYAHALGVLITHALVRQELEHRNISLPDSTSDAAIEDFKEEMGEDGLNTFLMEASIRRDDWEQLRRDSQALETFRNQVLLPQIKIDLDEIREYYARNRQNFTLPSYIRACFINAREKADLQAICKDIKTASLSLSPQILCADMAPEDLPLPWNEEQAGMEVNTCGKLREENGSWQTVVITSRSKEQTPKISDLYALIENILIGQKEKTAFYKWLEDKIAASSIMVMPEFNQSFALNKEAAFEN